METANRPTPDIAGRGGKPMPTGGPRLPNTAIGLQLTSYVPMSRYPKSGIPDGFPPTPAEIPGKPIFRPYRKAPASPNATRRTPRNGLSLRPPAP